MKRPHEDVIRIATKSNRQPSSAKLGPPPLGTKAVKSTTKPGPKVTYVTCPLFFNSLHYKTTFKEKGYIAFEITEYIRTLHFFELNLNE